MATDARANDTAQGVPDTGNGPDAPMAHGASVRAQLPGCADDAPDLVECLLEDDRWQALGLEDVATTAALVLLADLGLGAQGYSLCVLGADDARISVLNADFRGKPQPTNVLSWPADDIAPPAPGQAPQPPEPGPPDDPAALGDIALAYDTCAREAADQGKSLHDHVTHLVVHGILHLLGYDHVDDADATLMEAIETRALARLGIADPY